MLMPALLLSFLLSTQSGSSVAVQDSPAASADSLLNLEAKSLDAEVGQYVLCPSAKMLESAAAEGLDKSTIIYYTATVLEIGEKESKVRSLAGTEYSLPNPWIIPIEPGCKAEVGDQILTWWQSGSGMQRAIVVGGTETEPEVMYLDLDYDNPAGIGKRVDKLKPDSFVNLTKAGQIGTTAIAKVGKDFQFGRLIARDQNTTALLGFAGRVKQFPNETITFIPFQAEFQPGDSVWLHAYGSMREGKVLKVDPKIGRIYVEYPFGSSTKQEALSWGEVIAELK